MGLGGAIAKFLSQAVGKTAAGGPDAPSSELQAEELEERGRIFKSGAGLAIACVVIAVFVLAASFLKSILFGLILAYFLLPLEKWFERTLFKRPLARRFLLPERIRSEETLREKTALRASLLTFLSVALGLTLALTLAVFIAIPTVAHMGSGIKTWASSNETVKRIEAQVKDELGISASKRKAAQSQQEEKPQAPASNFQSVLSWAEAQASGYLAERGVSEVLASLAIDSGQNIMAASLGAAKFLFGFSFDILLTVFFIFYFLQKIAVFESSFGLGDGRLSPGGWLVKSIFETSWMPKTSDEARNDAAAIIDRIGLMLKAWIRGYLSIILVDTVLYTLAFLLFDVPYALPLGMIAGCTILVPFIGPIASGLLTLGVCFAANPDGASLFTVIGVLATYLTIHGVVENLLLYPRLVGETLGLTLLETIIVVLLGGLFGGIAGLIFSVPAAAVLKYLTPTVYHCWFPASSKRAQQEALAKESK